MSASNLYTPQYHDAIAPGSDRSATVIVPLVMSLLPCRSVVDVGCGTGAWLAEFVRAAGDTARAMVGVDGNYVERSRLMIDPDKFVAADLNEPLPRAALLERAAGAKVAGAGKKFDLAVCLEVAEHLRPERSEGFVDDLCALADVVLFSAAIPYQGGEGHINERWPTFWQELFKARGFELVDPIRKRVWSDRRVEPWYQQNTVMYAHWRAIGACPRIAEEHRQTFPGFLSMVHPRLYGPLVERTGLKPAGPWVPEGLRGAAKPADGAGA
jgi:SAM-dependent methyltransferase